MLDTIRINDLTVVRAKPARASGAPVLFVHGYFAAADIWLEWLPFFAARGMPAYAVNLRGRAGSKPGIDLGKTSIDDFADDATKVAKYLGVPAVVGHSMGGLIAQKLAERDVVRAAALVTPAPPRGILILTPRLVAKQAKYLSRILTSRVVYPNLEDLRELALNRAPPALQETALAAMVPDSGRAARDMSLTGVRVDTSKVRCPMLVITAEHDHFIPPSIVAKIARRYRTPLETVAGRGHMVVVEPGWQYTAELIVRWLAENS